MKTKNFSFQQSLKATEGIPSRPVHV